MKENCPNCIKPDEQIPRMPNGDCGVCGGKGFIVWREIGRIINTPLQDERTTKICKNR
jgi:hypothetical protein